MNTSSRNDTQVARTEEQAATTATPVQVHCSSATRVSSGKTEWSSVKDCFILFILTEWLSCGPRERPPMTLLSSFILAVFTAVEPAARLSRIARLSFGFQRSNSTHVRSLKCLNLLRFKLLVPTCRRRGSDTVYYWYKAEIFDKVVFRNRYRYN